MPIPMEGRTWPYDRRRHRLSPGLTAPRPTPLLRVPATRPSGRSEAGQDVTDAMTLRFRSLQERGCGDGQDSLNRRPSRSCEPPPGTIAGPGTFGCLAVPEPEARSPERQEPAGHRVHCQVRNAALALPCLW